MPAVDKLLLEEALQDSPQVAARCQGRSWGGEGRGGQARRGGSRPAAAARGGARRCDAPEAAVPAGSPLGPAGALGVVDTSGGGEGNSRPAAGERGVSGRAGRRGGLPAGGEVGQGEFVGRSRRAAGVLGKQVNGTGEASRGKAVASYGASVGENRVVSGPGGLWRRGLHPSAGCEETGVQSPFSSLPSE